MTAMASRIPIAVTTMIDVSELPSSLGANCCLPSDLGELVNDVVCGAADVSVEVGDIDGEQQLAPSDDGSSETSIIVVTAIGILLAIAVIIIWRLRSSRNPSSASHEQPPVAKDPTTDEHGHVAAHGSIYSTIPPDYKHRNHSDTQLDSSHQSHERCEQSVPPVVENQNPIFIPVSHA
jgi:hypothetical protein